MRFRAKNAIVMAARDQGRPSRRTPACQTPPRSTSPGRPWRPEKSTLVKFNASLGSRVIRVCNWGDVVCDFQNNPLSDAYGYSAHTSYPGSKPLLQAIAQPAHDAQSLHYYGGTLIIKGKVGTPVSASAVVIGGKTPLTVFTGIDGLYRPGSALP
jgi:hypothetical protein